MSSTPMMLQSSATPNVVEFKNTNLKTASMDQLNKELSALRARFVKLQSALTHNKAFASELAFYKKNRKPNHSFSPNFQADIINQLELATQDYQRLVTEIKDFIPAEKICAIEDKVHTAAMKGENNLKGLLYSNNAYQSAIDLKVNIYNAKKDIVLNSFLNRQGKYLGAYVFGAILSHYVVGSLLLVATAMIQTIDLIVTMTRAAHLSIKANRAASDKDVDARANPLKKAIQDNIDRNSDARLEQGFFKLSKAYHHPALASLATVEKQPTRMASPN